jgi:hypothetical protein
VQSLSELNPYVAVAASSIPLAVLDEDSEAFLSTFQCVVLADTPLAEAEAIDAFCRAQSPPIGVVYGDVRGLFSLLFVDFGAGFEVVDSTGEELKETYLASVTHATDGVVTTIDNHMHNLEDGDRVGFREVGGMEALNDEQRAVKVLSPYTFSIGDTTEFAPHTEGGVVCQLHRPKTIDFKSLAEQLVDPALLVVDFAKFAAPAQTLLGFRALGAFMAAHDGATPKVWDAADAAEMLQLAVAANESSARAAKVEAVDEPHLKLFSFTASGCLAPLCAAAGGWAAQEVCAAAVLP